jgi:hypothetical protein
MRLIVRHSSEMLDVVPCRILQGGRNSDTFRFGQQAKGVNCSLANMSLCLNVSAKIDEITSIRQGLLW